MDVPLLLVYGEFLLLSPGLLFAAGKIPVFSVQQVANDTWLGSMSKLGSSNPADSVSMIVQKADIDPSQQINFSFVSGNWGNDTGLNMWVTAKANLTSTDAVLSYTGTATASRHLQTISMTPKIWWQESTGDVLVYTSTSTTCTDATSCSLVGTFTPVWDFTNSTGTFFANVTTLYTLTPEMVATTGGNIPNIVGTIYPTGKNEPVKEVVVMVIPVMERISRVRNRPNPFLLPYSRSKIFSFSSLGIPIPLSSKNRVNPSGDSLYRSVSFYDK